MILENDIQNLVCINKVALEHTHVSHLVPVTAFILQPYNWTSHQSLASGRPNKLGLATHPQ